MTIALVIKVDDGVVLAADSATTMGQTQPDGSFSVANIYNNANKVFNLHKGLPIGAMTWGLGNIGPASISTLTKDLRTRFDSGGEWDLVAGTYDMPGVADRVVDYLYREKYEPTLKGVDTSQLHLGFLTAGYDTLSDEPRVFVNNFGESGGESPVEVLQGTTGAQWWGQPEAISRLVLGVSLDAAQALMSRGLDAGQAMAAVGAIQEGVTPQIVPPSMPIQDAIDLARFLVYVTIEYVRFCPGHATVGGPIEIATVTKHEGFKWVSRKHYYEERLNPRGGA